MDSGHGNGRSPATVLPVTVVERTGYTTVRGRRCVVGLGVFEILLGICIIALEAACVSLWYYYYLSSVGVYVGCFAVLTGLIGLMAGRRKMSDGVRRCLFMLAILCTIICALQALVLFAITAAYLATVVADYYGLVNVQNFLNQSQQQFGNFGNNFFGNPGIFNPNDNNNSFNRDQKRSIIGLKATLMILYLILFILSIVSSAMACFNCCNRKKSQQMVLTVYPNGQSTKVVQTKA